MLLEELFLSEKYTENNSALLRYMRDGDFDPYNEWSMVAEYLIDQGHMDLVNKIMGRKINPKKLPEMFDDIDQIWNGLPKNIKNDCEIYVIDWMTEHDPAGAPTTAHMTLKGSKPRLLARTTWLAHFTNNPWSIMREGFTIGMDDMTKLGLTTWYKTEAKKYGGYNFAFIADSRYARNAAGNNKYGKHCLLFQNSGVHAYHYGDEEDQVMFWGRDVDPRDLVLLANDYGDYKVLARKDTRRDNQAIFPSQGDKSNGASYEDCVKWVIQNFAQYRKYLTGR